MYSIMWDIFRLAVTLGDVDKAGLFIRVCSVYGNPETCLNVRGGRRIVLMEIVSPIHNWRL